jgi:hypothetical protein
MLSGDAAAPIVNGACQLIFFHFSGLVLNDPAVLSKNTDRFTLATRPDLGDLFAFYKATVLANKDRTLESLPYGFDTFSDGTTITRIARRLFAQHERSFGTSDPFDSQGPFFQFAQKAGLLAGKAVPQKATWREFSGTDRRVEAVHTLLRLALRLLGPNKYELLMRYLSHISVLRNQSVFLKPDR